jgi:elongation factor P
MKSTDLRPGMAIRLNGKLFIITKFDHVTPGNLRAKVQLKIKSIENGQVLDERLRAGEEVEQADLDRRDMEYLYSEAQGHVFMDTETFDQMTVSSELLGDAMKYVKPNTKITTLVNDGNVVAVELPKTVDLKVTDTPPGIKGATATNRLKEATMETGLKTRVPEFIGIGEVIRISTETGEYMSRV